MSLGGFDTHAEQEGAHAGLMLELSSALAAFHADLKGHGLSKRVLTATFSEFGRRVKENGSLGTDHGTANVSFVLGGGVTGGQYSTPPSLTDLVLGDNLQHTIDFRRVYATLIEEFLGYSKSEKVLGDKFATLDMFA